MTKMQIRFTGVGGQGVLTAGDILCVAAIKEGKHSLKIGTYTSRVRGGPTFIDILCDEDEIYYPYAIPGEIDFMLSVANASYQKCKKDVRPGEIIVIDPNLVYPADDDRKKWRIIEIPVVEIAKREIGNIATQSTLALGIMVHITKCVNADVLLTSILAKVPKKTREANNKAFALGIKYAEEKCA
ncbi:MAG: 2-oxoacid:acceptor oxidoreductase family protein [Candidatus Paceibacterota bacterium]|jgi:2-oxoglutarate ferredoxin oxidoreductase subunit gamma